MAKILLDIFLILLFVAVGALQVYVIFRIKELKANYNNFMISQQDFVKAIEKARQSLMLVNSQAVDVLPELKKHIEESDSLMQDFSFVLARANKKIDVLQEISTLTENEEKLAVQQQSTVKVKTKEEINVVQAPVTPMQNYQQNYAQAPTSSEFSEDPVLARLEQLEKAEQKDEKENVDFLKSDNKRAQHQQELIEKALREIL